MVTKSITLVNDLGVPPATIPRVVELERPHIVSFPQFISPKSCASPNVDIVKKSVLFVISLSPASEPKIINPRVPVPAFDPVPPPNIGSLNLN